MSEGVGKDGDDHLIRDTVNVLHYLGPPGTYSHQVALDLLPGLEERTSAEISLQPCETIKSTIQEAEKRTGVTGTTSWSLLPYENNSNGPVTDSYDVLFAIEMQVYDELKGGKDGNFDLKKLDVVSSHSQALGQCSNFLQSMLRSDVECLATTSTGEAARQLKVHSDTSYTKLHACISSKVCAQADVYDLVILKEGIQNSNNNTTRFLLLETSKEATESNASIEANHHRAIVRIETSAASKALTIFINKITLSDHTKFECHVRSIERRAKKDAVDEADSAASDEGHWPFVYLIEVEAKGNRTSNGHKDGEDSANRALKRAKRDADGEATSSFKTFSQHLNEALASAQSADESKSSLMCLGIWPVPQESY